MQVIGGSCGRLLCSLCVGLVLGRSFVFLGQIHISTPQQLGQRNVQEKGGNTFEPSCFPLLGPRRSLDESQSGSDEMMDCEAKEEGAKWTGHLTALPPLMQWYSPHRKAMMTSHMLHE